MQTPLAILTPAAAAGALPPVLLGYQQAWIADDTQLKIAEKGRRIGLTWGEAADDVLIAGSETGSNVFYISAAEDIAREYIEAVAMWARAYDYAASEIYKNDGVEKDRQRDDRLLHRGGCHEWIASITRP